jgi:hypothetical protein
MTWTILIESGPDTFTLAGETFEVAMEEVNAHLEELRAQTGKCHAAQAQS